MGIKTMISNYFIQSTSRITRW